MPPVPQSSDFPPSLRSSLSITPPPDRHSTNILLLLHGLGDSMTPFTAFASALDLPETTCISIQAPSPLPFELPGYHWGDDITFTQDVLDTDSGFTRSTRLITKEIIQDVLIDKLGYRARDILILGYAQGANVALSVALDVFRNGLRNRSEGGNADSGAAQTELAGIISVGGVVPLSAIREDGRTGKVRTPVLITGGAGPESAVTDTGVQRTKGVFEFVEVVKWKGRRGDCMPGNRDEVLPLMMFFARRLRSQSGVPEGSVEIT